MWFGTEDVPMYPPFLQVLISAFYVYIHEQCPENNL